MHPFRLRPIYLRSKLNHIYMTLCLHTPHLPTRRNVALFRFSFEPNVCVHTRDVVFWLLHAFSKSCAKMLRMTLPVLDPHVSHSEWPLENRIRINSRHCCDTKIVRERELGL